MIIIRSYTDLKQSKKLAEFLPFESADMYWMHGKLDNVKHLPTPNIIGNAYGEPLWDDFDVPCWSLAALLKLIPNFDMFKRTIECKIQTTNHSIDKTCELIDIAFEMVCWLKENNEL